ncbi:hypothetical protein EDC04DRAFT_2752210 [Pisolithus marmoratus]|nr:hypothetical protein EDC04DRAFT_2752210 [Pisolithus marmoratus]
MPLLGGLFKRDKHGTSSRTNPSSTAPVATESVAPLRARRRLLPRPTPVYSGPTGASSSKLKLPFRRNKHVHQRDTPGVSQLAPVSLNDPPPRSSVVSDPGHGLPPPPPKSSIFGVYNDRNSPSNTFQPLYRYPQHAIITDAPSEAHSSAPSNLSKKPGLFSWARQRTKSKPSQPPSTISSSTARSGGKDSSFNLMAFHHLPAGTNASLQKTNNASAAANNSLPPPRPRLRDERMSVAAFREAQARRSRAESPVPSLRPPSAAGTLRLDAVTRKRASTVSVVSESEAPQSNRASTAPWSSSRPQSSAVQTSSDSDDSTSEDDEDVDSGDEPTQKHDRERTITPRRLAQSETGHGSVPEPSPSRSDFGRWSKADSPCASPTGSSFAPRARASASASTNSSQRLSGKQHPNRCPSNGRIMTPILHLILRTAIQTISPYPEAQLRPSSEALRLSPEGRTSPSPHLRRLTCRAGRPPAMGSKQSPTTTHHRRMSSEATTTATIKSPSDSEEELENVIRLQDKEKAKTNSTAFPPAQEPEQNSNDRIIPTPIRERQPLPPHRTSMSGISQTSPSSTTTRSAAGVGIRPRSITLTNPPSSSSTDKSDSKSTTSSSSRASRIPPVPLILDYRKSSQSNTKLQTRSRPQSHTLASSHSSYFPSGSQLMPQRPFAGNNSARGDSPAPSSTGESSSGGPPFTPRDGSEIGVRTRENGSDVGSTLKARTHMRKSSVTFEDVPEKGRERGRERAKSGAAEEERRRERRRSEAKAAIEFGKLVNSRGPLVRDGWDDELLPRSGNGRMTVNPMMGMGMEGNMSGMMTANGWVPWQQPMATGMSGMVPQLQFNNDPAFLAAHQRAMMLAKQAYQMAVAQHAIAVAGEEWERTSNTGFGGGGSVYGGGSTASVYGGAGITAGASMPNPGMLMPPGQWHGAPVMFPSTALMYGGGISSTQSEFGGGTAWASRSAYGESFGPSSRSSYLQPGHGVPTSSASAHGGPAQRPRAQTGAAPPSSSRSPGRSRIPPPSSWKTAK